MIHEGRPFLSVGKLLLLLKSMLCTGNSSIPSYDECQIQILILLFDEEQLLMMSQFAEGHSIEKSHSIVRGVVPHSVGEHCSLKGGAIN